MLLSDDPTKGIEVTQVGGKMYVHGPASALNAPKDDWYVLDSNSGFTMNVSVPDQLDSLVAANGDWSRFQKSRNETFDGKKCDVYSAGKEAAGAIIETVSKPMLTALVADSGSVEMWVCDDGYLHQVNASVQAHDSTTPAKAGKIDLAFHIFEQDGNITIAAPANPLVAVSANSAAPTAAPIPTQPAASSGQSAPAGYAGDWNGTTSSADTPISFTVENKQVTFVNLSYSVQSGGCSLSGSLSKTVQAPIAGKSFTTQFTDDDGKQYLFAGTFASGKDANGTIEVKGTSTICGTFDAKATWTAKNAPADAQPTPSASTGSPQPGGATSSLDSMDVLLGFFDAINANDLDTAMTLVQDDVIMTAGSTIIIGKADLKTYLQKQAAQNVTYTAGTG
jgi:ketosteroid isomerase-like protein